MEVLRQFVAMAAGMTTAKELVVGSAKFGEGRDRSARERCEFGGHSGNGGLHGRGWCTGQVLVAQNASVRDRWLEPAKDVAAPTTGTSRALAKDLCAEFNL